MMATLTEGRWDLQVVFISIFLMAEEAKHFSHVSPDYYFSYLLLRLLLTIQFIFIYWVIGLLVFIVSSFNIVKKLIPCQISRYAKLTNIFFHYRGSLFLLMNISFAMEKLFNVAKPHLSILVIIFELSESFQKVPAYAYILLKIFILIFEIIV